MIDLKDLTLNELQELLGNAQEELAARTLAEQYSAKIDQVIREYSNAAGRDLAEGAEYVAPTGAHDAYPKGSIVTHDGKTWKATRAGANGEPGESPDWIEVVPEGVIPQWEQRHAGSAYEPGALVEHDGHVWRNDLDAVENGHMPGVPHSGWTDLGPVDDYDPAD